MKKGEVILADNFLLILEAMVKVSNNKLKIVCYKKIIQDSVKTTEEHFLELESKKVGSSVEFYILKSQNWKFKALPDFFLILTKTEYSCPESYKIGAEMLKKVGNTIFEGEILKNWNLLFKPIE